MRNSTAGRDGQTNHVPVENDYALRGNLVVGRPIFDNQIEILSLQQIMVLFDICETTALRYARAGKIPGRKIGGRWRFDKARVMAVFGRNEDGTD